MFTLSGYNYHYSRPMLTIQLDDAMNCWFYTTECWQTAIATPQSVTLLYAHPGLNTYMNVYGECIQVHNRQQIMALWTPALKSWFPGDVEDPALHLIRVNICHVTKWDNRLNKMIPLLYNGIHQSIPATGNIAA